ncbi:MAG: cell division protein FtsL [Gammaproteobacteria bacterium]|jgi:cell division protein FtsL|nr:cell division protein FtsL [Gammaproteobacteria bacterium]MBK79698.1 cell division protein FtsL [Gammaproteobacteria bacterium]|tara:strand:+ start:3929 stop:4195 length:267 start_codon:yes stop_codon:yes gene_type:complete
MTVRQALLVVALLLAVVASGVQVALVSHDVRLLHGDLEAAQRAQDEHLAEHSRLLLERSALSAYQNVERVAETELDMRFPDKVEQLAP